MLYAGCHGFKGYLSLDLSERLVSIVFCCICFLPRFTMVEWNKVGGNHGIPLNKAMLLRIS